MEKQGKQFCFRTYSSLNTNFINSFSTRDPGSNWITLTTFFSPHKKMSTYAKTVETNMRRCLLEHWTTNVEKIKSVASRDKNSRAKFMRKILFFITLHYRFYGFWINIKRHKKFLLKKRLIIKLSLLPKTLLQFHVSSNFNVNFYKVVLI